MTPLAGNEGMTVVNAYAVAAAAVEDKACAVEADRDAAYVADMRTIAVAGRKEEDSQVLDLPLEVDNMNYNLAAASRSVAWADSASHACLEAFAHRAGRRDGSW